MVEEQKGGKYVKLCDLVVVESKNSASLPEGLSLSSHWFGRKQVEIYMMV
jgi:hypothetical protein